MAPKWKRETVERLIISMQQYPCLYNVKSVEYLDRIKKAQAWNEILEVLLKINGCLNIPEIKRKWRNVRVQFVQEQRLLNNSEKSGAGKADIYVPRLWCYDQLCFLKTHTEVRPSKDNIEAISAESTIFDYRENDNLSKEAIFSQEENCSQEAIFIQEENSSQEAIFIQKENSSQEPICSQEGNSSQEQIFSDAPIIIKEPHKKKQKKIINDFRNDLDSMKKILSGKKELKFAWLGNLVATQMEEVPIEHQGDAAWKVQCLMRKLTCKKRNSSSASSSKNILELSMEGLFDDFLRTLVLKKKSKYLLSANHNKVPLNYFG